MDWGLVYGLVGEAGIGETGFFTDFVADVADGFGVGLWVGWGGGDWRNWVFYGDLRRWRSMSQKPGFSPLT
ncbi:MAG: hypothetical protein EAZ60_20130 [Oscillatoriales cyanobacterium]|nr:MAG: hypothetical protein EAZ83_03020 [Oscillatoriales cyanobacterium]TAF00270.1 MAG: hypothetical protein EAZ79_02975 [Oscillatoriales cyanobacterium]TAF19357.1 MAG: hypothetical protein EAZ73_15310 [Oscillatoriales cyanobacterium]TAF32434.1 MAG: hypothetical protein EAZ69_17965 [Oscillatoriales cyanobacterium]TAF53490.1 MAG: hypothetical protein EAZ60_20130 [Oscillatoriales cyanobacterium]